jgi:ATP-dependent Clp protease protease subunit
MWVGGVACAARHCVIASLQMSTPAPILQPEEVYVVFCDQINAETVKKLAVSSSYASQNNIRHIHLMFQSTGGFVGDGVFLYNLFRAVPIDLTIYNCGSVSSIAAVAFLGAGKRKASAGATFMIHRTTVSPQAAPAARLHAITKSIVSDDDRTETILRSHVNLTDDEWNTLDKAELWFSAEEALAKGFIDEIADFCPPKGSKLFTV